MKIALSQLNTRVGDIAANTARIIHRIGEARSMKADLVVFPELSVVGYPPLDLVEKSILVDKNLASLEQIRMASQGIGVVCGFVSRHSSTHGRPLLNSVALFDDTRMIGIRHKSLLPNYDVFDEYRHFEPATQRQVLDFRGQQIGLSVCEDAWNDKGFWNKQLYPVDPVEDLASQGAGLLINISASPFHIGKPALRVEMFRHIATKYNMASVFVNLVGGNDSLIFDGCSFAMDPNGFLLGHCRAFAEDLRVVEMDLASSTPLEWPTSEEEQVLSALVLGLRDYLFKCGFSRTLVGLSGGIDSALVAVLAVQAVGAENVTGVSMPSRYSSDHSQRDARQLADRLGIRYQTIPIEQVYASYLATLKDVFRELPEDITEENLQARIRGNVLMALSNKFNAMVLSTGNKSELAVGYCTIYGDMCGGLAVISDVPKTMVYRLAKWINRDREVIPAHTIHKPPSAELRPDQTDQDTLPPYDVLDGILKAYIEDMKEEDEIISLGYDAATVRRVLKLVDQNEYKRRQAAPGLRVTTKAFGYGRRIPIAQGWR